MTWREEHDPINRQHVETPEPGDFWHEMFSPYVAILAADGETLTVYRERSYLDSDHWTWDVTKPTTMTKSELRKLVTYETIPDSFVADVLPRHHAWAVDCWRERLSQPQLPAQSEK